MMEAATAGSHNPYPVAPTGFLVGSYTAFALYGIHLTQIHRYFSTYHEPFRMRLLVSWIFLLSTCQMAIILGSALKLFVDGIGEPSVWGTFIWPLSVQDGLIPIMAYTAQLYYGRRAWLLHRPSEWFGMLVIILSTITAACGIALAVTARVWSDDPWVSKSDWDHTTKIIGVPSQVVAITWMGFSALIDGGITAILLVRLRPHKESAPRLVKRLTSLTLETVLLTHICGAAMCIIFLASPPAHRTSTDIFWVLIEVITELYALSMLFTINSRRGLRVNDMTIGGSTDYKTEAEAPRESEIVRAFGVSEVPRQVEGYQGDTPFGVAVSALDYYPYATAPTSEDHSSSNDQMASGNTSMLHASGSSSGRSASGRGAIQRSNDGSTPLPSPAMLMSPQQDDLERQLAVATK